MIGAPRYDTYDLSGGGFRSSGDRVSQKMPTGATILATKAYALVDVFAACRVDDRIGAAFILQNAFDKRDTQYLNALPNPGRVAKAAISNQFATR